MAGSGQAIGGSQESMELLLNRRMRHGISTVQEAGQNEQEVDDEAAAPAQGNSYRSRKRKMKQAASQPASQQYTPGKRRRREYERLLEYTHAISNDDVAEPRGSTGKRPKLMQEAETPAKTARTPRRKFTGWQYVVNFMPVGP